MAMTIKEMAKDYATVKDGKETYVNSIKRKSFEAGANAVLEEIENILATEFIAGRVATDRLKLLEIHSRIKELKGE